MLTSPAVAPRSHAIHTVTSAYAPWLSTVTATSNAAYVTADLAIYHPVAVRFPVVAKKLFLGISTASGNVCVGIYDAAGVRLATSGTTAAAASLVVDITDTTLSVGLHYLAVVADNTTVQFARAAPAAPIAASLGVLTQQLGAGAALPATATWAVDQTNAYIASAAILAVTEVS